MFGKLFVVTLFDGRRTWQRIQTRNHLGDGGCGRVKRHHIAGPNDDQFNAFAEGSVLGEPDSLGIAAPERTRLGESHGLVPACIPVYTTAIRVLQGTPDGLASGLTERGRAMELAGKWISLLGTLDPIAG